MSRKKPKPAPSDDGIVDDGMFVRIIPEPPKMVPATRENLESLRQEIMARHDKATIEADTIPERVRLDAVAVLKEKGVRVVVRDSNGEIRDDDSGLAYFVWTESGNQCEGCKPPEQARFGEAVRDAAWLLQALCLKLTIRLAFSIGEIYQRMKDRRFAPLVVAGRNAKKGHGSRTEKQKKKTAERKAEYIQTMKELREEQPDETWEELYRQAADIHDVSEKTISNAWRSQEK